MTVNAYTDPESGLRFYTWRGRSYPSVTSIRRLIGMPFTLHQWSLSQVIDRAIVDHDKVGEMLARPRRPRERKVAENTLKEVRQHLRAAATEERDVAGDRGTRIHDAIATGLTLDSLDPDVVGPVAQYHDAVQSLGATVLLSERQVFNLRYGYAGTIDALWHLTPFPSRPVLPGGGVCVVDYKSSKGVYLDHAVQLIAYSMGEFVGENDKVDAGATQLLQQAAGMAILHLTDTDWELIEVEADRTLFEGFVGALAFATFLHHNNNVIDSLVKARVRGGTLVPALAAGLRLIEGHKEEAQQ